MNDANGTVVEIKRAEVINESVEVDYAVFYKDGGGLVFDGGFRSPSLGIFADQFCQQKPIEERAIEVVIQKFVLRSPDDISGLSGRKFSVQIDATEI